MAAVGAMPRRQPRTIRIPLNSSIWLDRPRSAWEWTYEFLCFLVEPILDPASLIELSIGLLLLERIGARLQRYEAELFDSTVQAAASSRQQQAALEETTAIPGSFSGILGSPLIAIFGTFALVFSCMANSSYNVHSTLMAPSIQRVASQQSSAVLLYLLLIFFCFESMLAISMMLVACHALTFPEFATEEHINMLFLLAVAWITSLAVSSFTRHSLYQSMGD